MFSSTHHLYLLTGYIGEGALCQNKILSAKTGTDDDDTFVLDFDFPNLQTIIKTDADLQNPSLLFLLGTSSVGANGGCINFLCLILLQGD